MTDSPPPNASGKANKREPPSWLAFGINTGIATVAAAAAVAVFFLSYQEKSAADAAKRLAEQQSQQITELQATTPVGKITSMVAYRPSGHMPAVTGIRNDPVLQQRIYDLSGTASNVPDNGSLFMVIHDYGQLTQYFNNPSTSNFYITNVTLSSKNDIDQFWHANGVFIGESSTPDTPLSYRLTLYFCNSIDAAKIEDVTKSSTAGNFGLPSLPYPSCVQLDSIFVTRGLH